MSNDRPTLEPAPPRIVAPGRLLGTVTVEIVEVAGQLRYRAHTEPALSEELSAHVLFVFHELLVAVATLGVPAHTDTDGDGR